MIKKIKTLKGKMITTAVAVRKDENGLEFIEILIGALIAVILGALLLHFSETSFNEIGGLLVNKIKSTFSL